MYCCKYISNRKLRCPHFPTYHTDTGYCYLKSINISTYFTLFHIDFDLCILLWAMLKILIKSRFKFIKGKDYHLPNRPRFKLNLKQNCIIKLSRNFSA